MNRISLAAGLGLVLLLPASGLAQDKETVYRKISPGVLEDILRDLEIRFKKGTSDGRVYWDFERNKYKVRLTSYDGKDLMLDALFNATPVERLNAWNVRAKFSRAVLYPGNGKPYAALEANLDCLGGVTPAAIKQFLRRFETEVKSFSQFLEEGAQPAASPGTSEVVYPRVSADLLMKILKSMNLNYTRNGMKYDFLVNNMSVSLIDFNGGDVMLTAEFRPAALQDLNEFNLKHKFTRAVLYRENGRQFTALERNLDAVSGITEGMLRHFISSYANDVREFELFLSTSRNKGA
jgi:hypothetical protein